MKKNHVDSTQVQSDSLIVRITESFTNCESRTVSNRQVMSLSKDRTEHSLEIRFCHRRRHFGSSEMLLTSEIVLSDLSHYLKSEKASL